MMTVWILVEWRGISIRFCTKTPMPGTVAGSHSFRSSASDLGGEGGGGGGPPVMAHMNYCRCEKGNLK